MRTSGELRDTAKAYRDDAGSANKIADRRASGDLYDAADLIDAVAWWFAPVKPDDDVAKAFIHNANDLLSHYRDRKPAKPSTGCEGCKWYGVDHPVCFKCARTNIGDRWEAMP